MALADDSRAIEELFAATLQGDYEDDAAWEAVASLRRKGTQEVFEVAMKYSRSDDPKARARGLDVLAQLRAGKPDSERPHLGECISTAIEHLKDPDPLVVHSAAWALAHLRGDRAISALIELKRHMDPDVRKAVAVGIQGSPEAAAIETLIELMEDPDDDVRDWATFELGTLNEADSPEVAKRFANA